MKKHGIVEMNLLISIFVLVKNKTTGTSPVVQWLRL